MQIPLRVDTAGHPILSVGDLRREPPRSAAKCLEASASLAYLAHKSQKVPNGGIHLPYTARGLYPFETLRTIAACTAVTLGGTRDSSLTDPKKIAMEVRVNWGHASAQQLHRALLDSEGNYAFAHLRS